MPSKSRQNRITRDQQRKAAPSEAAIFAAAEVDHASGWPSDVSDLAEQIALRPSQVTNKHRDLLARNMPTGVLTRRDGSSVRPVFQSESAK